MPPVPIETVRITAADGVRLVADIARPDGGAPPVGAVVVAHPHPLYGGDRRSPVVGALFDAWATAGWAAIRFDFRGAGMSEGEHDHGIAERLDIAAALDAVAPPSGEGPVVAAGYSFGSLVALQAVDQRITHWVAVAPPLGRGGHEPPPAARDPRPKLVIAAGHDQFTRLDATRSLTSRWVNTRLVTLPMADHFLAGHTGTVADAALEFVSGPAAR
mgnify:CR=1 FL=1